MKIPLVLCIAMGVFVAHLGALMLWSHLRPTPPPPPKPNFTVRSQTVTDRETGEKTVYREITVSTRFTGTPTPVAAEMRDPRSVNSEQSASAHRSPLTDHAP